MSRWSTPRLCANAMALHTSIRMFTCRSSRRSSSRSARITSRQLRPSMCFMTIAGPSFGAQPSWWTGTMFGCSSRPVVRASANRAVVAAGSVARSGRTVFTATSRPSERWWARRICPMPPSAMCCRMVRSPSAASSRDSCMGGSVSALVAASNAIAGSSPARVSGRIERPVSLSFSMPWRSASRGSVDISASQSTSTGDSIATPHRVRGFVDLRQTPGHWSQSDRPHIPKPRDCNSGTRVAVFPGQKLHTKPMGVVMSYWDHYVRMGGIARPRQQRPSRPAPVTPASDAESRRSVAGAQ